MLSGSCGWLSTSLLSLGWLGEGFVKRERSLVWEHKMSVEKKDLDCLTLWEGFTAGKDRGSNHSWMDRCRKVHAIVARITLPSQSQNVKSMRVWRDIFWHTAMSFKVVLTWIGWLDRNRWNIVWDLYRRTGGGRRKKFWERRGGVWGVERSTWVVSWRVIKMWRYISWVSFTKAGKL